MKTKLITACLAPFIITSALCAATWNISSDTSWTDATPPSPDLASGDGIFLTGSGTLDYALTGERTIQQIRLQSSGGGFNMTAGTLNTTYFWFANDGPGSNSTATISGAGTAVNVANNGFSAGNVAGNDSLITIKDGAVFTTAGSVNIASKSNVTMNLSNGGTFIAAGQANIGAGNGDGGGHAVVNIGANSVMQMRNGMNFIGAWGSSGEINMSGGNLSNNGSTGRISQLMVGFGSDGSFNMSGGEAYIDRFSLGSWVTSATAKSTSSISGSAKLDVTKLEIGTGTTTNQAVLTASTGARIVASSMTVSNSGSIVVKIDKAGIDAASKASSTLISVSGDSLITRSGGGNPFTIDFSSLGLVDGLDVGDVVTFSLFSFTGKVTFNGADFSKNAEDFVSFFSQFVSLENYTDIVGWNDVSWNDFHWDSATNSVMLNMTYAGVPEPSTCAAIIGALAFGYAAYRRKK